MNVATAHWVVFCLEGFEALESQQSWGLQNAGWRLLHV